MTCSCNSRQVFKSFQGVQERQHSPQTRAIRGRNRQVQQAPGRTIAATLSRSRKKSLQKELANLEQAYTQVASLSPRPRSADPLLRSPQVTCGYPKTYELNPRNSECRKAAVQGEILGSCKSCSMTMLSMCCRLRNGRNSVSSLRKGWPCAKLRMQPCTEC